MCRTTVLLAVLCLAASAADDAVLPQIGIHQTKSDNRQAPGSDNLDAITIPRFLSYQGRLTDTLGVPVPNGSYSVVFRLYTLPSGGSAFWNETRSVTTEDGLFAVLLGSVTPIGSMPDAGAAYLTMAIEGGAELVPRLRIASAGYAYLSERAASADLLQGKDTTGFVRTGQASSVTSAMIINGTIVASDLNQMGAGTGQVLKWTGTAWAPRNDSIGGGGTVPDSVPGSFAVTTDLRVYGKGRIGPGNSNAGTAAFVAGEGNVASANYSSVSGGADNSASSIYSHIGGGGENRAAGGYSFVGGGASNHASGGRSSVVGGSDNEAYGLYAAIGGGLRNTAGDAVADTGATVTGGYGNLAIAEYAFVGGGQYNAASALAATVGGGQCDTASDWYAFVGGGYRNKATANAAVVVGGQYNAASALAATVGGGIRNVAGGVYATIAGGNDNEVSGQSAAVGGGSSNHASADNATVGGGASNEASAVSAAISGGWGNGARGRRAFVGGGYRNSAGNAAGDTAATVAGGQNNAATAMFATVGGGRNHTASGMGGTIAGGASNIASGDYAAVGGGVVNEASNNYATVAGGYANLASGLVASVAGGSGNHAVGEAGTVAGGANNIATGSYAAIPGGQFNHARGSHTFAAGRRARANHQGSFVWSDSSTATSESVYSTGANQFRVRARGGTWFFSNAGMTTGAYLAAGSNAWASACDSVTKTDFRAVDRKELLEKVTALRVREYRMKDQEDGTRHIGPVAQDFSAAFGYGENNTSINMADMDGVTLAAIQALYEQNREMRAELEALKAELARR
ncbi:MAG: tail fiber domain-containing protein [bacterium]